LFRAKIEIQADCSGWRILIHSDFFIEFCLSHFVVIIKEVIFRFVSRVAAKVQTNLIFRLFFIFLHTNILLGLDLIRGIDRKSVV